MKTGFLLGSVLLLGLALSACTQGATPSPAPQAESPEVLVDAESGEPVIAECSRSSDDVRLLINSVHGYCLQYPAAYDVSYPNDSEVRLFQRSIFSVSEPSVSLRMVPAGNLSLEQAADQIEEQYAIPGTPPRRESLTLGSEDAVLLAGLSGQDPNSQVVVRHGDRLYYFFFIEMNRNDPEAVARAEVLYDTVIASFNFRPESNACPGCAP